MRKLASIQTISKLEPIEGADKIEKATVLGWELVVKKGDFKEGDSCVYCEIDSILPEKPEFEFLRDRKFRIKTIKLRGQVSQGICFPVDILPYRKDYHTGMDVTEILGVKKYDPIAVCEQKERERREGIHKNRVDKFLKRYKWYRNIIFSAERHPFPKFIKKTDEDRIQLFPDICEEQKGVEFVATEKLDGTSFTAFSIPNPVKYKFWKKYLYGICSRNFHLLKWDNSPYCKINKLLNIENRITQLRNHLKFSGRIVIQGEIVGIGVQGNKYKLNELRLYLFNVYLDDWLLNDDDLRKYAKIMDLEAVPFVSKTFVLKETIPQTVKLAEGDSVLNKDTKREGLVVRDYNWGTSFKIINPEFLLKYGE